MIGHAVGQAVGQGGRSRRSVGQRPLTGYDRPMTDHDRPLPSLVLIILQDTQKLLSIVLSYSFIVNEIERTCVLNSSRLFLYLYQMLIEIPFLKKSIYLPHWCNCFYVIADCLDPISRVYYTNIVLGDVYEGPATIPSSGYRSPCISLKI